MRRVMLAFAISCACSSSKPQPIEDAPPPYDLASDRAHIEEVARTELGASTTSQTAEDVFVLVAAPGWNKASLAASTDLTTRAIDAYFNGRFDTKPARAIGVYLFADAASYQAYCKAHPEVNATRRSGCITRTCVAS
jgi:hypothetical protein